MTCGCYEDCPNCGHSGGYPIGVEPHDRTVVTMECAECSQRYQVDTTKNYRPGTKPSDPAPHTQQ